MKRLDFLLGVSIQYTPRRETDLFGNAQSVVHVFEKQRRSRGETGRNQKFAQLRTSTTNMIVLLLTGVVVMCDDAISESIHK